MGVEASRGRRVWHACRHSGCLGQDPGAVDGLRKGDVGRGSGGGWHVEVWVDAGVAHCDQVLFSA